MGSEKIPLVGEAARKERQAAGRSMTPKQIKRRAKRQGRQTLTREEKKHMITKPIEDWDIEELAKGRPKDKNGHFTGAKPAWITRDMHEKALKRFHEVVRGDMNSHAVRALTLSLELMEDRSTDEKGRPMVPAGVKADLAKFMIEHLVGKPTQPTQVDINVKLAGVLADSLVMPGQLTIGPGGREIQEYIPSSSHRSIESSVDLEDILDVEEVT